jgi:hypothetical protein
MGQTNLTKLEDNIHCQDGSEHMVYGWSQDSSWSPDGSQIAYEGDTSCKDASTGQSAGSGTNIWVMNSSDGSEKKDLIQDDSSDDYEPSWSPDGTKVVFASDRDDEFGYGEIYTMDADGEEPLSGLKRLTFSNEVDDLNPDWGPPLRAVSQIKVTANKKFVSPNEKVTFKAMRQDGTLVNSDWSGGGTPKTGTGTTFTTRFDVSPGFQGLDETVTAKAVNNGATDSLDVKVMRPSGTTWVGQYPGDNHISALAQPFQDEVQALYTALTNAGASVPQSKWAVYRPPARAHLMQTSSQIARGVVNPQSVPNNPDCPNTNPSHGPIYIGWDHYDQSGTYLPNASVNAAKDMAKAYGTTKMVNGTLVFNPVAHVPHPSHHETREAIDWNISWPNALNGNGTLKIKWGPNGGPNGEQPGTIDKISTTPRTGLNHKLWQVGKSYGVIKFELANPGNSDPPHWSDDGH